MIDALLLGNGAMVPLPDRPLSSLQIRVGDSLVLFDCGEGTQVQMRRFHWGFRKLDAICLSHLHADHVAGLPSLFHTVAKAGRTDILDIYGPPGTIAVVQGLSVIARHLPYPVTIHELEYGAGFRLANGLRVRVARGEHRIECLAYRVDRDRQRGFNPDAARALGIPVQMWSTLQRGEAVEVDGAMIEPDAVLGPPRPGVSLGFATDTRPTPEIIELMQDVDLLVAEATYASDDLVAKALEWGHMTMREACRLGETVRARQLWLTHFGGTIKDPASLAEAACALYLPTTIGMPGLAATIAFPDE
ncbi:MAG TPA: ribonuclease Z [Thermomicrobiales bacterium]|nr:ribonuclease Z [Thermomicrobiales bacterium]